MGDIVESEPVAELGYGSYVHSTGMPCRVFALESERITSVAVGIELTVAVTEAGVVYSFGYCDRRLGYGKGNEQESQLLPRRIEALNNIRVATVAAGDNHVLALTKCGRVSSWGAAGRDSPVYGLGSDGEGGSDGTDRDDAYYSMLHLITALLGERVRAISPKMEVSAAMTDAGALYTWGDNEHGNLGPGDVRNRDRPTLVQGLQGIRVVGVAIDDRHTLALAADGDDPGLGISLQGDGEQVARRTSTPQMIPNLKCTVPR
jgi:alpha-tubulin suppressor-like RCC1 family protein